MTVTIEEENFSAMDIIVLTSLDRTRRYGEVSAARMDDQ